jgi:hypothetical protein
VTGEYGPIAAGIPLGNNLSTDSINVWIKNQFI